MHNVLGQDWGLQGPLVLHRYIATEPDIKAQMAAFLRGDAPETLDVYGPPTIEVLEECKRKGLSAIQSIDYLPRVRLRFVKAFNPHVKNGKVLQVVISPADQAVMASWLTTGGMRKAGEYEARFH